MEKKYPQLIEWMDSHIGPGRTFTTETAWARKAAVPVQTLNRVRKTGAAEMVTLFSLGRAVGFSPVDILLLVDLMKPDEIPGKLTARQREWLRLYDSVSREKLDALFAGGRALVQGLQLPPAGRRE